MKTDSFSKGWYLLYTNSKQEKKVADQLLNKNIKHFLPLVKVARKWSDRIKLLDGPLFPSYVFIYLEGSHDYYNSLAIKGVLNYVKFRNEIAKVPDVIVNNLKIILSGGKNVEISEADLEIGETLTIGSGPFIGLNCEVIDHRNKKMILVRIELLKRNVLVEIPAGHVYREFYPIR